MVGSFWLNIREGGALDESYCQLTQWYHNVIISNIIIMLTSRHCQSGGSGIGLQSTNKSRSRKVEMVAQVNLQMEDGFFGNFKLDNQASLVAPILTLSTGGFNIAIPKKTHTSLKNGDHLKFVCIIGTANLNFISDIPAEITSIEKQYRKNYMSADCKFLDLADSTRQQIIRLVDHERKMRGQYG